METHYCYILKNDKDNYTYVGYTNNLQQRLRKHNCIIKGGARFTTNRVKKNGCKWEFLAIIELINVTRNIALSLEWHIKHVRGCDRISAIEKALSMDKFENVNAKVYVSGINKMVHIEKFEVQDISIILS